MSLHWPPCSQAMSRTYSSNWLLLYFLRAASYIAIMDSSITHPASISEESASNGDCIRFNRKSVVLGLLLLLVVIIVVTLISSVETFRPDWPRHPADTFVPMPPRNTHYDIQVLGNYSLRSPAYTGLTTAPMPALTAPTSSLPPGGRPYYPAFQAPVLERRVAINVPIKGAGIEPPTPVIVAEGFRAPSIHKRKSHPVRIAKGVLSAEKKW